MKIKDNTNENYNVDNYKIKEDNKKIVVIGDSILRRSQRSQFL